MSIEIDTPDSPQLAIGLRLKLAREERGLAQKDVAEMLRLKETIIAQLEQDTYAIDLPHVFLLGYLRAYAKLMSFSEADIKAALSPIQPKETFKNPLIHDIEDEQVTAHPYFLQFFSYLMLVIFLSVIGYVWYQHENSNTNPSAPITLPIANTLAVAPKTQVAMQPAASLFANYMQSILSGLFYITIILGITLLLYFITKKTKVNKLFFHFAKPILNQIKPFYLWIRRDKWLTLASIVVMVCLIASMVLMLIGKISAKFEKTPSPSVQITAPTQPESIPVIHRVNELNDDENDFDNN